jgi:hypothetical protein
MQQIIGGDNFDWCYGLRMERTLSVVIRIGLFVGGGLFDNMASDDT